MNKRQSKKMKNVYNQSSVQYHSSNFKEATRLLIRSAQGGYRPAMLTLGRAYYFGNGVPSNVDKAVFWLQRAADKGSRSAHFRLGLIYYAMLAPNKVLPSVDKSNENFLKPQRKQLSAQQLRTLAYDHFCIAHKPLWMGIMNYEAGKEERAYDNFMFAYEKNADPLSALYLWRMTKDSKWYERGESLLGDNAKNWNDWAYTLCEWGEYAKALPYIEKALNMENENEIHPAHWDTYAECLCGLGRMQEAEQMFRKSLEAYRKRNYSLMSYVTLTKIQQIFQ